MNENLEEITTEEVLTEEVPTEEVTTEDLYFQYSSVPEEDFTSYQYIRSVPEQLNEYEWYVLASRGYNLALTGIWLILAFYLIDKVYICFSTFYRGKEK